MIQVASENYSQENFLGLGKKNKAKRQAKRAVRKEKRAAKKDARQGKGLLGKVANRLGVGKQAKEIRKDAKAAKAQIKTTGTYTKGTVRAGTIRKAPVTLRPTGQPPGGLRNHLFGGAKNGKPMIKPIGLPKNLITPIAKLPTPVRGTTPVQRGGGAMPTPVTPQTTQTGGSAPQYQEPQYQEQEQEMAQESAQGMAAQNADPNAKKPFNWKLWGGVGGGAILVIVIILIVVLKK